MTRARLVPLVVLALAVAALGATIAAAVRAGGDATGMMRFGPGVMGDAGGGPVRDMDAAARRAGEFAQRLDLRAGEVMRFDNHYYVELVDGDGRNATEVLVDPDTGSVVLEPGPAMMWNTRYGMMGDAATGPRGMMGMMGDATTGPWRGGTSGATVTAAQARAAATRWLRDADPGVTAGEAEAFPGYYTLHTLRGGRVEGMLSVHAATGAVWYHWWHGDLVGMRE
ncbi:MAG: hypothetical protein AB1416_12905 [Actinomycetota bacterium]